MPLRKYHFRILLLKGPLSGLRKFLATESPLKVIKKAFYFPLKALFVLKIFKFCVDFLVMYENGLIRNIRLILKFRRHNVLNKQLQYTYCPISQEVKGNQTMKFGQLIEITLGTFLLKNHTQNVSNKLFPDPYLKKSKLSISLDQ